MFQTVIFDLDGTLLNTIQDLAYCANLVCRAHGWPTYSVDTYKTFVGDGMPKLVERFSPPDQRTPEALARTLEEYLKAYSLHKEDTTAPYPGIPQLLADLKREGVQTGVLSNKDDGPAKAVVEHYLPGLVHLVKGRVDGVPAKPDPTSLHHLMDELGADPAATLFVGDSNVDILTGRNGGLTTCGVLWGFRTREELRQAGADYLAADTGELAKLIREGTV